MPRYASLWAYSPYRDIGILTGTFRIVCQAGAIRDEGRSEAEDSLAALLSRLWICVSMTSIPTIAYGILLRVTTG
jgi:hypothetical protein